MNKNTENDEQVHRFADPLSHFQLHQLNSPPAEKKK